MVKLPYNPATEGDHEAAHRCLMHCRGHDVTEGAKVIADYRMQVLKAQRHAFIARLASAHFRDDVAELIDELRKET